MNHLGHKKTAWFTCFLFMFLLLANTYPIQSDENNESTRLIQQGEQLFDQGEYEQALKMFEKAIPLTRDTEILVGLYLKLSLIFFKLDNPNKSEESLRSMFELTTDIDINEDEFEAEYSMIYKKIKAEYWFSVRTKSEAEKKEDRQIIEKLSKKPEKKKNKLVPILLIAGVAIAVIFMAVLMWPNKEEVKRGILKVYNVSEYGISVIVGSINRSCSIGTHVNIFLEVGTYQVEITGQGNTKTYTVTIEENQTSAIFFHGWDV